MPEADNVYNLAYRRSIDDDTMYSLTVCGMARVRCWSFGGLTGSTAFQNIWDPLRFGYQTPTKFLFFKVFQSALFLLFAERTNNATNAEATYR